MGLLVRMRGKTASQTISAPTENGRTVTAMTEFLAEHWILIYGLFMWALGSIFGYFNGKGR
jgi:hypothetical protein